MVAMVGMAPANTALGGAVSLIQRTKDSCSGLLNSPTMLYSENIERNCKITAIERGIKDFIADR